MKFFTTLLLAFATFFGCAHATEETEHLSYYWSGDEDDLDLYIKLQDGLEFLDEYTTTNYYNGACCELVIKPIPGVVVLSEEGVELTKIKFKVIVLNTDNPHRVICKIFINNCYNGIFSYKTKEISTEIVLHTPSIDTTEQPVFYLLEDSFNERVVTFKNLFPCLI